MQKRYKPLSLHNKKDKTIKNLDGNNTVKVLYYKSHP